jgi:hypothetical protein
MNGTTPAILQFFDNWNQVIAQFWVQFAAFRSTVESVIHTLLVSAPQWGTTVITWVVQWIPGPIRLLFLFLLGTWLVGLVEDILEWFSVHHYHKSFINAYGKRVGGYWTRGPY